jgi:hydrogenase nickel incorporation protein HypA/HybF
VHERALMTDLMREIEAVARADGAARVTRVSVRLGALSHFTEEHFREHFVDASRGTLAEGAAVDAVLQDDLEDPRATGVVLESVELEVLEAGETG